MRLLDYYEDIKRDYPVFGGKYCCEKYNLKPSQVNYISVKLKLRICHITRSKINSEKQIGKGLSRKVDADNFKNLSIPINSYILGLLWADGHLGKNNNNIVLTSTYPDADYIENEMKNLGWNIFRRKDLKYPSWKERCTIHTSNNLIKEFLLSIGFSDRTLGLYNVINIIPVENLSYFWRGLSDGDGCFYYRHETSQAAFSIASNYNQNWDDLEKYLLNNSIYHSIERKKSDNGSYSKLHICNFPEVIKWGDIIYKEFDQDSIGLRRKYDKYIQIKNHKKRHYIWKDANRKTKKNIDIISALESTIS